MRERLENLENACMNHCRFRQQCNFNYSVSMRSPFCARISPFYFACSVQNNRWHSWFDERVSLLITSRYPTLLKQKVHVITMKVIETRDGEIEWSARWWALIAVRPSVAYLSYVRPFRRKLCSFSYRTWVIPWESICKESRVLVRSFVGHIAQMF